MKPSAKSRNANSISTLIDTLSERNSLYLMNVDCFCFIDCAVEIVKASWRKSVNDYVKTNLHSKEQLNRNHGDQNIFQNMWLADTVSVTVPLTLMKNLKSTPGSIPVTHNHYISPANYSNRNFSWFC